MTYYMNENELFKNFSILMFVIGFFISGIVLLSTLTNRRIQLIESRNKRIAQEELERSRTIDAEIDLDMEMEDDEQALIYEPVLPPI